MPSADPRDCASTGEPCAVKAASTVRGGADGTGLQSTSPAAYSTYPVRGQLLALLHPDCQDSRLGGVNGRGNCLSESARSSLER